MTDKSALLFPGQGSQVVGMGADIYESFPETRHYFDEADALFGRPLTTLMFGTGDAEADAEALRQTDVTQPALFVMSFVMADLLKSRDQQPAMAAGHSLGEYSALAAAGALSFEEGLSIVKTRGELMARAGAEREGAMAAIIGMEDEDVIKVCHGAEGEAGSVTAANFNSPGQIVVSGDPAAVERCMELATEAGARKVVRLVVSGAFHSPLMQPARTELEAALGQIDIKEPDYPVYANVTAAPSTDPDRIRESLVEQLVSPVRWADSLRAMEKDGAGRFTEVGSGRVLSGLVKRTLGRTIPTRTFGTVADVADSAT